MPTHTDSTPDGGGFKHQDAASYDDVTEDFERYTERFSLRLAEPLVDLVAVPTPTRILDVGCGTGAVTRLAARRFKTAEVTGIDLSDGMLRSAGQLTRQDGVSERVRLLKQDAEKLDLADDQFDCILSLFALRHFPNPLRALEEMRRVARPGARVAIAVGSAPPAFSAAAARAAVRVVVESLQEIAGRAPLKATAFLDDMLDVHLGPALPDQEAPWTHGTSHFDGTISQLMRQAGFADVRTTWVGQSSEIDSIDDFWRLQATFSSRARKRLPLASAAQLTALRHAFDAQCRRHLDRGGKLVYRTGALVGIGVAPD